MYWTWTINKVQIFQALYMCVLAYLLKHLSLMPRNLEINNLHNRCSKTITFPAAVTMCSSAAACWSEKSLGGSMRKCEVWNLFHTTTVQISTSDNLLSAGKSQPKPDSKVDRYTLLTGEWLVINMPVPLWYFLTDLLSPSLPVTCTTDIKLGSPCSISNPNWHSDYLCIQAFFNVRKTDTA